MRGRIEKVLEEVIRPLVEADGGSIELQAVHDDLVVVVLRGTCIGCPGFHYTRHHVVEPALKAVAGGNIRVDVRASAEPPPAP